jgi:hypothetical protein
VARLRRAENIKQQNSESVFAMKVADCLPMFWSFGPSNLFRISNLKRLNISVANSRQAYVTG